MEKTVKPGRISGQISAPPSKSMTQRAIAAAALSEDECIIHNPSYCDDSLAGIGIARSLGAEISVYDDKLVIHGFRDLKNNVLDCGESGLAIRLYSPVAALYNEKITLTGKGSLTKRPMGMIGDALTQLGVTCTTNSGFLPLTIKGPVRAGKCIVDGSVSSQLLTGMLMALPLASDDSEVTVNDLKSKPYIDMTLQLLGDFGISIENQGYSIFIIPGNQKYQARTYSVEGDWSGGAFLLVAAALAGRLRVRGLRRESRQSDIAIIDALKKAGADLKSGRDYVEVSRSALKAFEFDATECPDLFPPLVALASCCNGTTSVKGVSRLAFKESNRADTLKEEFGKIGIRVELDDDIMKIHGGNPKGSTVSPHNDHRIAMALAVTALAAESRISITDANCVDKSYPGFFKDLAKAGAVIEG
jgi:3-phosphoshikimate 1-carboxyvinyltransferase